MTHYQGQRQNYPTLVIHSTDNSFGFGYRKNSNLQSDDLFIKKFDNDLCNNLIVDFTKFVKKKNFQKINKISVSIGPANFNASRQIVVLARTLSQQINCSLDSFSSFELMAKRIAIKNDIYSHKKVFWIFKKLKRRGYIAGQYEISISEKTKKIINIKEKLIPKIFEELKNTECSFQAEYNEIEDLKELLNLSDKNSKHPNLNSWDKVLPSYPISPTD